MINGKITNNIEIYPIPGEEFSSMEGGGGAGEGLGPCLGQKKNLKYPS